MIFDFDWRPGDIVFSPVCVVVVVVVVGVVVVDLFDCRAFAVSLLVLFFVVLLFLSSVLCGS